MAPSWGDVGPESAWSNHHDDLPQGVVVCVLPRVPHNAVRPEDLAVLNGVSATLGRREREMAGHEKCHPDGSTRKKDCSETPSKELNGDAVTRAPKAQHFSHAPSGDGNSGRMNHPALRASIMRSQATACLNAGVWPMALKKHF